MPRSRVSRPRSTWQARCRTGGCCSRTTRTRRGAELAVAPGRALGDGLPARRGGAPASACAGVLLRACEESRASRCSPGWRATRRVCGPIAASCGSRPGRQLRDRRGDELGRGRASSRRSSWSGATGSLDSRTYPDALRRIWAALRCAGAGDVLVSAAREYEFADWGGADHVGGGSHGSLRRGDSLAALAFVNCGPDLRRPAGRVAGNGRSPTSRRCRAGPLRGRASSVDVVGAG